MLHSKQPPILIPLALFIMFLMLAPACYLGGPDFAGPPGMILPLTILFLFIAVFIALIVAALKITVKLGGLILAVVMIAFGLVFISFIIKGSPVGFIGPGFPESLIFMGGPLLGLLWILVIVWVYRDAEERGMNGALWALLVLVGNIIGLIIYLIVRNEAITGGMMSSATVTCPNCKKIIKADYTFCPHCSAKVSAVCPSCEKPVETGWKACPYCGHALKEKT